MRLDERGPRQGWVLLLLLGAWIDTRLVENALDRIGAGVKAKLFFSSPTMHL